MIEQRLIVRAYVSAPAALLLVIAAPQLAYSAPPRQFYSNGQFTNEDPTPTKVWDYVANSGNPTPPPTGVNSRFNFTGPFYQTWHFYRKGTDVTVFERQYLRKYRDDPDQNVYYFNVEVGEWTGFWDPKSDLYSRLPKHARRRDLRQINFSLAEPPGEMTKLSDLGKQSCCRKKSPPDDGNRVAEPP
ncbi:MAG TPA: hypothetical protein VNH11_02125 [Pirellulales bacterium]|nr:hypothetical protein [Pirellulales bacterium]